MARPRVVDEAALLRAARDVFIRRGAEATTREVADAAGVSQALLFQRYGTKRRLFFAAMLPRPPELADLLGEPAGSDPASAQAYLHGLACRLLAWIEDAMPGGLRAALHPSFPDALGQAHGQAGADAIVGAVADRLRVLQDAGGIRPDVPAADAAAVLVELLHGQALAALLQGTPERSDRRAAHAVDVLWRGLEP